MRSKSRGCIRYFDRYIKVQHRKIPNGSFFCNSLCCEKLFSVIQLLIALKEFFFQGQWKGRLRIMAVSYNKFWKLLIDKK